MSQHTLVLLPRDNSREAASWLGRFGLSLVSDEDDVPSARSNRATVRAHTTFSLGWLFFALIICFRAASASAGDARHSPSSCAPWWHAFAPGKSNGAPP